MISISVRGKYKGLFEPTDVGSQKERFLSFKARISSKDPVRASVVCRSFCAIANLGFCNKIGGKDGSAILEIPQKAVPTPNEVVELINNTAGCITAENREIL